MHHRTVNFPRRGPRTELVGNGTDFTNQVAGAATLAEGSFDSVSGVTGESGGGPVGGANSYSLQLNTQFFTTTTCNGTSGCQGWEQFVYSSTGCSPRPGCVFIQYWLLNYAVNGTACPTGWTTSGADCVINSTRGIALSTLAVSGLAALSVTGTAATGAMNDTVTLTNGTTLYSVTGDNRFPDLAQHWQVSEFNVFGNCCGSQATFNSGASVNVRISADSGTLSAPSCIVAGFTAETNNLTLVTAPETDTDTTYPSILFTENFAGTPAPATCATLQAAAAGQGQTDVPLPPWTIVTMGAGLLGIAWRRLQRPA